MVWGAILDIIANFFNICSTSNLPAKLYIEYSHCYFFLPNPSTYAMFYEKDSCFLIQYGQLYVPYGMMHRAPVSLK